jgi:hypothetical protein
VRTKDKTPSGAFAILSAYLNKIKKKFVSYVVVQVQTTKKTEHKMMIKKGE